MDDSAQCSSNQTTSIRSSIVPTLTPRPSPCSDFNTSPSVLNGRKSADYVSVNISCPSQYGTPTIHENDSPRCARQQHAATREIKRRKIDDDGIMTIYKYDSSPGVSRTTISGRRSTLFTPIYDECIPTAASADNPYNSIDRNEMFPMDQTPTLRMTPFTSPYGLCSSIWKKGRSSMDGSSSLTATSCGDMAPRRCVRRSIDSVGGDALLTMLKSLPSQFTSEVPASAEFLNSNLLVNMPWMVHPIKYIEKLGDQILKGDNLMDAFKALDQDSSSYLQESTLPFWRCTVMFGSTGMIKALSNSLNELHRRLIIVNKTGRNCGPRTKTGTSGITKMWVFRLALETIHALSHLCYGLGATITKLPEHNIEDLYTENQLCQGLTGRDVRRFMVIFDQMMTDDNSVNEDALETRLQEFLVERGNRIHLNGVDIDSVPPGLPPGIISLFNNNNDINSGVEQFIHSLRRAEWLRSEQKYIESVKQMEDVIELLEVVRKTISLIEMEGNKMTGNGQKVLVNYQFRQISQIVNITAQCLKNEYDLEFCKMARALLTSNLRRELKDKGDGSFADDGAFHWLRTCVDKVWAYLGNAEVSGTGRIRSPRSLRVKGPTIVPH